MSVVVFLGAVGRSGTTLMERTLATSGGFTALGEVVHLWDRGVRNNEPCGCGQSFTDCSFWSAVGEEAFGGWSAIDLEQIARDRRRVDRNRYIPLMIVPRLAPRSFREARARLLDTLDRLYAAAEVVSAAEVGAPVVLLDSSKHPSYLFLLRSSRAHDVRMMHVVRDPRGVAYSWSKTVSRPESVDEMERLGTLRSVARWTSHNLLFSVAAVLGVPSRHLSYERFVREPGTIGQVAEALVGGDVAHRAPLAVSGPRVDLGRDHTVSGNPMRFRSGSISISPDEAWRASMPSARRRLVGLLTTPLRQVYLR